MTNDITFTRYFFREDGTIHFGVPVPGRNDLKYHTEDDGTITLDSPIEEFEKAWDEFVINEFGDKNKLITLQTIMPDYQPKENRTRTKAGNVSTVPNTIATPSTQNYQYALTTVETKHAHLELIKPVTKLTFENGVLYFDGIESSKINLIDYSTKKGIDKIDLPTLRLLYSVILQELQTYITTNEEIDTNRIISHSVTIYIPEMFKAMGMDEYSGTNGVKTIISKIAQYQHIIGIMPEYARGRIYHSLYPVMLFTGYSEKKNTISFCSPYINVFITNNITQNIRRDKKGIAKRKKNGQFLMNATNSYLIKASIAKERNKRACEIVFVVVTLIEQTGKNNTPHIKAQTIIERCPDLKQALENSTTANKNKLLKRTFEKAWELLETQTYLTEKYKNIKFPTTSPTSKTLDMVFEFPHDDCI